jgi:charged multivesicular body protein 7
MNGKLSVASPGKSELIQSGRMIPLKPFLENQKSIYFTDGLVWKVANMLVARPLWWAMEQMNVVGESTSDNTWKTTSGDYVLVDLLEASR